MYEQSLRALSFTLTNGSWTLFVFGCMREIILSVSPDEKICPSDGKGCGRAACQGGRCMERPGEIVPDTASKGRLGRLSIWNSQRHLIGALPGSALPDVGTQVTPFATPPVQDLTLHVSGLEAPLRMGVLWVEDLSATPLDLDGDLDRVLRGLAAALLDDSWGRVEGVVAHQSWRGFLEIHVWTSNMRGRPIELHVGPRFGTTKLPGTLDQHTAGLSHGWLPYTLPIPQRSLLGATDATKADPDHLRRTAVQLAALELQQLNAIFDWRADRPVPRQGKAHDRT